MANNLLYQTALQFIECEVFDHKINIPYMVNHKDRYCSPLTKGKAPINELVAEFKSQIKGKKINIENLSSEKIRSTFQLLGIGIDCSGFAYQVLNPYIKQKKGKGLSHFLLRFPGLLGELDKTVFHSKRYEKISAACLMSTLNTMRVDSVSEIKVGDLIQMTHQGYSGKHPLVVIDRTSTAITYAHSSEYTEITGAHFGTIMITDQNSNLDKQLWLEKTKKGENYGQNAFRKNFGDSVRRLKCLRPVM